MHAGNTPAGHHHGPGRGGGVRGSDICRNGHDKLPPVPIAPADVPALSCVLICNVCPETLICSAEATRTEGPCKLQHAVRAPHPPPPTPPLQQTRSQAGPMEGEVMLEEAHVMRLSQGWFPKISCRRRLLLELGQRVIRELNWLPSARLGLLFWCLFRYSSIDLVRLARW